MSAGPDILHGIGIGIVRIHQNLHVSGAPLELRLEQLHGLHRLYSEGTGSVLGGMRLVR